jgi:DNA-binding NarL/FixJ family response regulator
MGLSQHQEYSTTGALQPDAIGLARSDLPGPGVGAGPVVIVHRRALDRECLARGLQAYNPRLDILAVASLDELGAMPGEARPAVILLVLGDRKVSEPSTQAELRDCGSRFSGIPVVLVADEDGPAEILAALDGGAQGYVPTSANTRVLTEAIALALSGGSFVPASSIFAMKDAMHAKQDATTPTGMFTNRQASVAKALRQGKANKIIAYELNMCESTVKVHVRHIMKKLGATNRTEVAYKLSGMAA